MTQHLTRQDFISNQEVRWCPGCGDYAILAAMQKLLPELNIPKENFVFVSGIGCAGRFPYYLNTYGFHTIHGRAPSVATGLKVARPELSVWVITGDGDGLSIGGNHLMHTLRRNVDVKILLFNNRIYGLTKGQYSPTSEQGKVTNTTPQGSIDRPIDPIKLALAAGATFVARALDVDAKGLQTVLQAAALHKGAAFVEIYQNCHIYNDKAFASVADKATRAANMLWLEQGRSLLFADGKQGIFLDGLKLNIREVTEENQNEVLIYDQSSMVMANLLSELKVPTPMGIFHQTNAPSYETLLSKRATTLKRTKEDLEKLLHASHTWSAA